MSLHIELCVAQGTWIVAVGPCRKSVYVCINVGGGGYLVFFPTLDRLKNGTESQGCYLDDYGSSPLSVSVVKPFVALAD